MTACKKTQVSSGKAGEGGTLGQLDGPAKLGGSAGVDRRPLDQPGTDAWPNQWGPGWEEGPGARPEKSAEFGQGR